MEGFPVCSGMRTMATKLCLMHHVVRSITLVLGLLVPPHPNYVRIRSKQWYIRAKRSPNYYALLWFLLPAGQLSFKRDVQVMATNRCVQGCVFPACVGLTERVCVVCVPRLRTGLVAR